MVDLGPPGDDEVQLVPVPGPGMSPRHSVVGLGGEEGVSDCEVEEGTKFKEALAVLIELSHTEVAKARWPGGVPAPTRALKSPRRNSVFLWWNRSYPGLQVVVEGVLVID